ncbi:MAG: carboxypeptidase-like regulatory domain-containing protein, partial [Planctomycetota bacterium]
PWSHGFGGPEWNTDNEGRFVIEHVNPDVPGHYSLTIEEARGCRPFNMKLEDLSAPVIIQLEKGYGVSGVVVDDETGLPMPGVEVYALPKDLSEPEPTGYLDAEEQTDENGRFRFENMGRREYVLHTRGGQRHRDGKLVYGSYPVTVVGGQGQQVTIRKRLREGSSLKRPKP